MTRLEHRMWRWHVETYGEGVDIPATYRKLCEEVGELGQALMEKNIDAKAAKLEAADIGIILNMILKGLDPQGSLSVSMAVKLDMIEQRSMERRKGAVPTGGSAD